MWIKEKGRKKFKGNQTDYAKVASLAASCNKFSLDDEDEQVDDNEVSCYNCLFRRWSSESFFCMSAD